MVGAGRFFLPAHFISTGFPKLEDEAPPIWTTPPTAYSKHGNDLKFGMNVPPDHTFGGTEAIFKFLPLC